MSSLWKCQRDIRDCIFFGLMETWLTPLVPDRVICPTICQQVEAEVWLWSALRMICRTLRVTSTGISSSSEVSDFMNMVTSFIATLEDTIVAAVEIGWDPFLIKKCGSMYPSVPPIWTPTLRSSRWAGTPLEVGSDEGKRHKKKNCRSQWHIWTSIEDLWKPTGSIVHHSPWTQPASSSPLLSLCPRIPLLHAWMT